METREDTGISLGQSRTWKQVRRILPRFALRGALSHVHVEVRGSRLDKHLANSTRTRMGVHCPWEEAAALGRVQPPVASFPSQIKQDRVLRSPESRLCPHPPLALGRHSITAQEDEDAQKSTLVGQLHPRGSRVLGEGPGFPVGEPIEMLGVLHSLSSKYRTSHP